MHLPLVSFRTLQVLWIGMLAEIISGLYFEQAVREEER